MEASDQNTQKTQKVSEPEKSESQISDTLTPSDTPTNRSTDPPSDLSDLSEASSSSENDQLPHLAKSNKKSFLIGGIIAGVIVLIVVGFFITKRNISQSEQTPQPTTTSTPSPTATPKPAFDRSQWSLEVLNGSGVTGAAKKLADKLAKLGYKILKTGNADKSDYKISELFVAKDLRDKQDLLLQDLKKEITIASVSGELTDSTASARIIIGKE